ncbi:MAG: CatB-related O-acetyltransferase [Kutzneria sp.]|nr:CatB-related O-acetyltransferase [Kutzneria sp.]MBV9844774.1 CatB-related O-acetyltransferase [Kutzneria sp.]
MAAPDPTLLHPIPGHPRVVFLKPLVVSPYTSVGEFTYYDDPVDPTSFERDNVLYQTGPERLVIGKYCAIASGAKFIMNANRFHRVHSLSTYPFPLFGSDWRKDIDLFTHTPSHGDTVIGNDVWIGHSAIIMPGVRIGDGAVIGAGSVVTTDIPPYGVVAGNPARLLRLRFDEEQVAHLLRIAWWDWPVEQVTRHLRTIMSGTVEDLAHAVADNADGSV